MPIERFIWTTHAEDRRAQRMIDRSAVESAIGRGHVDREFNLGDADWLIRASLPDGRRFEAIYDHPVRGDRDAIVIVSVWDL